MYSRCLVAHIVSCRVLIFEQKNKKLDCEIICSLKSSLQHAADACYVEGLDGIGMFPAGISDGRSGLETGGGWPRKEDPRQSEYVQGGKVGNC